MISSNHLVLNQPHTSLHHSILYPPEKSFISEHDIVYYLGYEAPKWSPYDPNLGGSEQAVKHLEVRSMFFAIINHLLPLDLGYSFYQKNN